MVGAIEPRSDIVDRVLGALFAHASSQADAKRGDLAVAVVLEEESEARSRNAPMLARVRQVLEWRGDSRSALGSLLDPATDRAEVGLARTHGGVDALLSATAWMDRPRFVCDAAIGESDGLGGVALAVAAGRIATGHASEALVLGVATNRGFAILLAAP